MRVDSVTPTVLIYAQPSSGLEAKFSMPFCAAAAVVYGRVGIDTFDAASLTDPLVTALMTRVHMRIDSSLDGIGPPLTEARVSIQLRNGGTLTQAAHGARGYPEQPASSDELGDKFMGCARRTMAEPAAERVLALLRQIDRVDDVRTVTALLVT